MDNFSVGTIVFKKINSNSFSDGTGASVASAAVAVYKDNSTTESTAGASITTDFDARTGLIHLTVDTSADGTFYSAGGTFAVVLTAGSIGGASLVGKVLYEFTLTKQTVASVVGNVGGNVVGSVASVVGNVGGSVASVVSFGTLVSDIVTAVWGAGTRTLTAISDSSGITTLLTRILGTLASGTHNPQSGDAFARLGAPTGASIAADIQTRLPTSSYTAPPSASTVAVAVWSLTVSGNTTSGSFGAAMNAAGSAGDPWSTPLPGSYAAGTAGFIIGTNLNATVSSRLAGASFTGFATPTNVSDAQAAILARLPAALVGGRMDASVGAMAANTLTASALAADAVAEIRNGSSSVTISRAGEADITYTETRT